MNTGENKKIALCILSDPLMYPPTVNAANILADKGFDVFLYGLKYTYDDKIRLHPKVKLIHIGTQKKGLSNVLQFISCIFKIFRETLKHKFQWIIAYDAFAVIPVYISSVLPGVKWVYHQHDFWEKPLGLFQKIIYNLEYAWGSKADIVSFPQAVRAKIFSERSGMQKEIIIVYNAPRKSWIEKEVTQNSVVKSIREKFQHILIYQGGLAGYFCLDKLIQSIKLCKSNFAIILLGRELEKGIVQRLTELARKDNVEERIFFWNEYIAYDDLPSITSFCDIGVAKLTHENMYAPINDKYLAGASNKIAEYMASGLPIIAPNTEDNRLFFDTDKIGLLVDPQDTDSIAETIDNLLLNSKLRMEMSERNKLNFINKYNFDSQFERLYKYMFPNIQTI